MTKIEQVMLKQIEQKGFALFHSVRAFSVLEKRQSDYPHLCFSFSISSKRFGGRSDWNNPKRQVSYEVAVRPIGQ